MGRTGDAVGDTSVGEAAVTTLPIPYDATHAASLHAVRWLGTDALTLANPQTAPIFTFPGRAAEGDTAIAACASIPDRRERKSAHPSNSTIRSSGE